MREVRVRGGRGGKAILRGGTLPGEGLPGHTVRPSQLGSSPRVKWHLCSRARAGPGLWERQSSVCSGSANRMPPSDPPMACAQGRASLGCPLPGASPQASQPRLPGLSCLSWVCPSSLRLWFAVFVCGLPCFLLPGLSQPCRGLGPRAALSGSAPRLEQPLSAGREREPPLGAREGLAGGGLLTWGSGQSGR